MSLHFSKTETFFVVVVDRNEALRRNRARLRWFKTYTLIRNPTLGLEYKNRTPKVEVKVQQMSILVRLLYFYSKVNI